MANPFRHSPPRPDPAWIDRHRLVDRLDRRYELRVVLVVAPAGYGKTAALAQALDASATASDRLDLWLQCQPADASAEHLVGGILRSAGLSPDGSGEASTVVEALVRCAPREVCLVIDDVHHVPAGSLGARVLDELAEQLPTNAHLVLSGRTRPALRLARRQLAGEVETLGRDDLAFDLDEIDRLGADASDPDNSWPAWSALVRDQDGPSARRSDYLIQEVVAGFSTERAAALAALSVLRHVDDGIALAATNGSASAALLLGDLPLVHQAGDGSYQLHDLWCQALVPEEGPGPAASDALGRVAEHVLAAGDTVGAAELFTVIGDNDGLRRAATEFLARPLTGLASRPYRELHEWCQRTIPDDPVTAMFEASIVATGDERVSVARFEAVAARARGSGDVEMEILALQNVINMRAVLDPNHFPDELLDRVDALVSDGHDLVAMAAAIRAHRHRSAGDPERSAAELWRMGTAQTPMAATSQAFGYGDLGRPEDVVMPPVDDPTSAAARAGGQHLAQAMWLRGDASPELALELGTGLAAGADEFAMAHVQVSTNAVLALVAVAAGDNEAAQRFVNRASAASNRTAAGHVRSFADIARASLLAATTGDVEAAEVLARALDRTPIGNWPARPYIYSLPLVYVLAPATRPVIDRCVFGPALTVAARAACALVAVRERNDPALSADLPWRRINLLRAHVLPPHLAELAAAAASTGSPDVEPLLAEIPALRDQLVRVTAVAHGPSAAWAQQRIGSLPQRPEFDLDLQLLGPTSLRRGSASVTDASWMRRERVRELLAALAMHRRISRQRLATLVWPDLPDTRALSNLRVNLHHLQSVLQPGRTDDLPWFVQMAGDELELVRIGVTTDVDRFEHLTAEARRLDDAGRSTMAIERYGDAVSLYRGDLIEDLPKALWADADRARLRATAIASMSRLGELLLARGEPEVAAGCAADVLRREPLNERGARLLASCLEAQDDRVGASRTLRGVMEALAVEGMLAERQTLDQANRLGLA